jgi:type II secretory ATPase GspE/PulE/Tfp pilus assembly ATPase PilB-like protein
MDLQTGNVMLAVLKAISTLNINERRAKQEGTFGIEYRRQKYSPKLISQGTPTGERVLVKFDAGKVAAEKLEDTGMRQKMEEELRAVLATHEGIVLFSAPPAHGFSTSFNAALNSSDRYIRNWAEVVEASKQDHPVENVPVTTYDASQGETPMTVLPKLLRTYPDVVVVRDMVNKETVELLIEQAAEEKRLVICGIRAKDAIEALVRVLLMKVTPSKFAPHVLASINMRLVRKLCESCMQPYAPTPQALQQLGIPAGRVQALFRHHEGPLPLPPDAPRDAVPMPCKECLGIGFKGRTAIFELLLLNDEFKAALAKVRKADAQELQALRAIARKGGFRNLQEEGIALVAKGVTSVQEIQRVLKE